MGFRFRKSVKIAPGVRLNFGKKSTSVSFGGKGARYTVSSTGRKTASVGIPGTGLSYVETVGGNKKGKDTANMSAVKTKEITPMRQSKPKKPFFKKWWFWIIMICIIGSAASTGSEDTLEGTLPEAAPGISAVVDQEEQTDPVESVVTEEPEEVDPAPVTEEETEEQNEVVAENTTTEEETEVPEPVTEEIPKEPEPPVEEPKVEAPVVVTPVVTPDPEEPVVEPEPEPTVTPNNDNAGSYIGNINSNVFHSSGCKTLPKEKNRVYFDSRQEAVDANFKPCGNCKP